MDLVRFDPLAMFRDLDRLIDRSTSVGAWAPRIDIVDRDDTLVIRADVAGIDPADIEVTVEDKALTISGARSLDPTDDKPSYRRREIPTGQFTRTLVLPEGLNTDEISASAANGVLEIAVPRSPEVLPRKVKVDVSS